MNLDFSSIEKNADEALKTAIFSEPSILVTSLKILMRTGKLDIFSSYSAPYSRICGSELAASIEMPTEMEARKSIMYAEDIFLSLTM